MTARFPNAWPQDCPPPDAEDADGTVFRLVKEDPLHAKDFQSQAELGKYPKAQPCLRVGLSVLRSLDDARHMAMLMPFLGNRIAQADLQRKHGKLKPTRGKVPTHTTWWPYAGIERASIFTIVDTIGVSP